MIESHRSTGLLFVNVTLTILGLCAVFAAMILFTDPWSAVQVLAMSVGPGMLFGFVAWVVLYVLCVVEYAGIRFYGRRRGWRTTAEVAWTVVGHASFGWLLLPITLPLFWWLAAIGLSHALDGSSGLGAFGAALNVAALVAGPGVPLLAFEILVYIGFRRLRFANAPEAM